MARAKKHTAPVETAPRAPDEVLEKLIAAGINTNDFLLELNGFLSVPYDFERSGLWALPSGLFAWPIAVTSYDGITQRRMSLMHPGVKEHPFVQHVEQALGIELEYDPSLLREGRGGGWHGYDLMTAKHWRDLIATRHLTTDAAMVAALAGAVRNGLSGIGTKLAREILGHIGLAFPENGLERLCQFSKPTSLEDEDKVTRWPVNHACIPSLDLLAAYVVGLERGWLKHDRSGHLQWTELGVERHGTPHDAVVVESKGGQFALAF